MHACVQDPWWTFMMTGPFICTPAQVEAGVPFWFHSPAAPHGATVIAALKRTDIIAGPVR